MARITLGLATSHSPHLNIGPDYWAQRGEEDHMHPMLYRPADGAHLTYDELLEEADPGIMKEITPDVFERRYRQNEHGINAVADALAAGNPDVLIMVGDDQHEVFQDDNMPALAVYCGEEIPYFPRPERGGNATGRMAMSVYPDKPEIFPCASNLAMHIIDSFVEHDVDVAHSRFFREGQPVGHAFVFVYHRIMRGAPIPTVLLMQNTYYPPAQPTPKRSYTYGRALREAVESWPGDEKVAVLATGGMSHFVVDEELDRKVLKAMQDKDAETLKSLPKHRLKAGTSEIRNWLTVAGAVEELDMHLHEYVPCYRSPAGTGCAMGFVSWS